jgi:hypothetical protein
MCGFSHLKLTRYFGCHPILNPNLVNLYFYPLSDESAPKLPNTIHKDSIFDMKLMNPFIIHQCLSSKLTPSCHVKYGI